MKKIEFKGNIIFIGCGAVGQGTLPLVLKHINIKPNNIIFISDNDNGKKIVEKYECFNFIVKKLDKDNYISELDKYTSKGDFLINLSVNVESISLIKYCQKIGILYIDTCTECWEGGYIDENLSMDERTNYYLREQAILLKKKRFTYMCNNSWCKSWACISFC